MYHPFRSTLCSLHVLRKCSLLSFGAVNHIQRKLLRLDFVLFFQHQIWSAPLPGSMQLFACEEAAYVCLRNNGILPYQLLCLSLKVTQLVYITGCWVSIQDKHFSSQRWAESLSFALQIHFVDLRDRPIILWFSFTFSPRFPDFSAQVNKYVIIIFNFKVTQSKMETEVNNGIKTCTFQTFGI